jgi:hypothetical protein
LAGQTGCAVILISLTSLLMPAGCERSTPPTTPPTTPPATPPAPTTTSPETAANDALTGDATTITVNGWTWTGEQPPYADTAPWPDRPLEQAYVRALPDDIRFALDTNDQQTFTTFAQAYRNALPAIMNAPDPREAFIEHFTRHRAALGPSIARYTLAQQEALHAMQLVHGALLFGESEQRATSIDDLLAQTSHDAFDYITLLHEVLRVINVPSRLRSASWTTSSIEWSRGRPPYLFRHTHLLLWAEGMILDPLSNIAFDVDGSYWLDATPMGTRLTSLLEQGAVYRGYCWLNQRAVREQQIEQGVDGGLARYLVAYAIEGLDSNDMVVQSLISPIPHDDGVHLLSPEAGVPSGATDLDVTRSWFIIRPDRTMLLLHWHDQLDAMLDAAADNGTRDEIIAAMWPVFESAIAYRRVRDALSPNEWPAQRLHRQLLDAAEHIISRAESRDTVQGWGLGRPLDPMNQGESNPSDTRYTVPTHRLLSTLYALTSTLQSDARLDDHGRDRVRAIRRDLDRILDSWSAVYHETMAEGELAEGWYGYSELPRDRVAVTHATTGMGTAWLQRAQWTGDPLHLDRAMSLARFFDGALRVDRFGGEPRMVWSYAQTSRPLTELTSVVADDVRFVTTLHRLGWLNDDEVIPLLRTTIRQVLTAEPFRYSVAIDGAPTMSWTESTLPATAVAELLTMTDDPAMRVHVEASLASIVLAIDADIATIDDRLCFLRLLGQLTRIEPAEER